MRRAGVRRLAALGLGGWLILSQAYAYGAALPETAQPGDLVFREGTEPVSDAVMAVDGGPFSHVGMLVGQPGAWQVVHATPSEVPGRPDGVVLDTLDFFVDAKRAKRYAIYRVNAEAAHRTRAVQAAQKMLGTPFRVADPMGTYCTVLVWDAWRKAGIDLDVSFTRLNLPLLNGEYLLPSALMASKRLQWLTLPPDGASSAQNERAADAMAARQ